MPGAAEFITEILRDTPKAFYMCQEASGTIVDSISGGGQNLTNFPNGAPTYQQPGPMGDYSIRFPVSFYAFSNNAASLLTDDYTLGYWGKLGGSSSANGRPSFRNGSGGGRGFEIEMDIDGTFYYVPDGGNSPGGVNSTAALTTTEFKLIHVVRRDGTTEYYVNGVQDEDAAGGNANVPALAGDAVQLGAAVGIDILIAHAFIFETPLSADRILTQYKVGRSAGQLAEPHNTFGPF